MTYAELVRKNAREMRQRQERQGQIINLDSTLSCNTKDNIINMDGGPGSGNFGHGGRPGQVGGSGGGKSGASMTASERASYKGPRGINSPKIRKAFKASSTNTSDRGKDDSLAKHCDANGKLSPEREKLHQKIVEKSIANAIPEKHPTFLMMGGGPAAGKGTIQGSPEFIKKYGAQKDRVTIDPDEMKKEIPEYREMVSAKNHKAAGYAHEESSALAKRSMDVLNKSGCSYTLDGTGDGSVKSLMKKINNARAAGMKVNAVYVTCDTELAVKRAVVRGEKTGRYVDPKTIRKTHRAVSQILPQCADKFDKGELYDTSGSKPILIATFGGGKGLTPTKGNERLLKKFLDKANE